MNNYFVFFALFCFVSFVPTIILSETCSYENCALYKKGLLNVHLVCHSHDDIGWLKTVDQYFWGTNRSITKDTVNYILNTVYTELLQDPRRKFSYAESGFFSKWWDIQDDITRHSFLKLVNRGQFEFVGGGWVQHDEAATHYAAIVDQMTLGHRFLNTTFGRCGIPKVAWQIDPFGHSRESAALFAMMNLEALFFARIHYADRKKRKINKSLEMIWHGSDDLGKKADILTGVFYEHYMPPDGFCFDAFCNNDPMIDDKRFESYNVKEKVDEFLKYVSKHAASYNTGHIMLTMGGDFHYSNANAWFSNLDKLIKHVNARQKKGSRVNVFYSTPTCYARAIANSDVRFPGKSDDFFPYANDIHSYWTGYFTSRPTFKGYVRGVSNLFQVCQSLDAIAQLNPLDWGDVDVLHRGMGVMQHHDAITGTAKQHVTNDYSKILHHGVQECQQVANDAMKYLSSPSLQQPPYHSLCTLLNETVCNVSQSSDSFLLTVHNGLSKQYLAYVRLPVNSNSYTVLDAEGANVVVQIDQTPKDNSQLTYRDRAPYELIFPVELPALGYVTYYVKKGASAKKQEIFVDVYGKILKKSKRPLDDDHMLENEFLIVNFNANTGLITSVTDKRSKTTTELSQKFFWYKGANASVDQPSGAYIFRPNGTDPYKIGRDSNNDGILLEKITGPYVQEMRQTFADWVTQRVRLVSKKPYIEFEWTIGPIPSDDKISREIITRFDTNIKNDGIFYTDSNGRQMLKRRRNYAPTYEYNNSEPVAANYYPVNSRIFIKDDNIQMTVLTDRSQGGASLIDGSIELMIHRRLLQDDHFGVEEALNETGPNGLGLVASGKHWLLFDNVNMAAKKHRFFAMEMFYQPLLTFAPFEQQSFDDYRRHFKTWFAGLTNPLPQNVHILTVAQWRGTNVLLRFEHIFQLNEDHEYSRPVTLPIKNLFTTFDILTLDETNLSASEFLCNNNNNSTCDNKNFGSDFSVTLNPMDIRTFLATIKDKRLSSCAGSNEVKNCL